MSKRITRRGAAFASSPAALAWLCQGFWVYENDKPVHPEWAVSWHVQHLLGLVRRGALYECLGLDGTPFRGAKEGGA